MSLATAVRDRLFGGDASKAVAAIETLVQNARTARGALVAELGRIAAERKALAELPPPRDVLAAELRQGLEDLRRQALKKLAHLAAPLKNSADNAGKLRDNLLQSSHYSVESFLQNHPFELLFTAVDVDTLTDELMAILDWADAGDTHVQRTARLAQLDKQANGLNAQIAELDAELAGLGFRPAL